MDSEVSFEDARDFKITGGNFGKVGKNVKTINVKGGSSGISLSRVLKHLSVGSRRRNRLATRNPGSQRTSSIGVTRSPTLTATTHSPIPSDSSDAESSDFEIFSSVSIHSEYSTGLSSLGEPHQSCILPSAATIPSLNTLDHNRAPPPENQSQLLRPSYELPGTRTSQVQHSRAESGASFLPAYSSWTNYSPPDSQNTTPGPFDLVNTELPMHPSPHTRSSASAQTTPLAYAPTPAPHPNSTMFASPRTSQMTPRQHNLPHTRPHSTVATPAPEPTPQCQAVLHDQPAFDRVHSRPLPPIPGTSSAFPQHTPASHMNLTPRAIQPQVPDLSPISANAAHDIRVEGAHGSESVTERNVWVDDLYSPHMQTSIPNHGDYRVYQPFHTYPHGYYAAAPMPPPPPFYPQYSLFMTQSWFPWGGGPPPPQWPQYW